VRLNRLNAMLMSALLVMGSAGMVSAQNAVTKADIQRLQAGKQQWPGVQLIMHGARIGGTWSNWYESFFKCGGFNSSDRVCVGDLDAKFTRYLASIDPAERKQLAEEVQRAIMENHYVVPVFRHAFMCGIGPRIAAQTWQDVWPTITTGYAYPWEDIKLKG